MHKRNLFISAALTAFLLVILTGVVAAARLTNGSLTSNQSAGLNLQAADSQAANNSSAIPTAAVAVESAATALDPQSAALLAANFLGQTDLYSVENAVWNDREVFKVTFSSGYIVYVGTDGQLLGVEVPQLASGPTRPFGEQEGHEEHDND